MSTVVMDRRMLVACALLASMLLSAQARASDDAAAMVSHGLELRRQGRDEEALAEFQRALKIDKAARTLAQAGLAEQALGLWAAAERDLTEALAATDPWIAKNTGTLKKALTAIQSHLGTLQVWGTPEGATVLVNAKRVGTLPLEKPIRVSGDDPILLTVKAEGYPESTRRLHIAAGEIVRQHVELVPNPTQAASDDSSPNQPPQPIATPGGGGSPATPAPADAGDGSSGGGRSVLRPLAWGTGVAALGALTFGVIETFIRQKDKNTFNDYAMPNPNDPTHPIRSYCNVDALPPECRSLKADFDRANTLMIVGYAVGGGLAVASTVLFLQSSEIHTNDRRSALACLPDMATNGVTCHVTF